MEIAKNRLEELKLSLENIDNILTTPTQEGIADIFKDKLPAMFNSIINYFKTYVFNKDDIKLKTNIKKLNKTLNEVRYIDLKNINAFCPEGLNKTYLEYLKSLEMGVDIVKNVERYIDEFSIYIGALISDRRNVRNTTINNDSGFLNLEENINKALKSIGSNFTKSTKTTGKVGDFVRNNKEFNEIFDRFKSSCEYLNKVDKNKLSKNIKKVCDYLVILKEEFKRTDPGYYDPGFASKVTPKIIAKYTYNLANVVSLFSSVSYAYIALGNSIDVTCENILEAYS